MIVECPRCSARYRVEEEVLRDEPTFKCSRCSHIFSYDGGADEPPRSPDAEPPADSPAGPAPARAGRSESLSFRFAEKSVAASSAGTEESFREDAAFEERSSDDEFVFHEPEEEAAPFDEEVENDDPPAEDEPRFVRGEDELRVEPETRSHPERPYLVFVFLLALLYANLALYLRNHPAEASQMLASIPLAGRMLTEDRLLQTRIHLDEIEGVYQKIKDDRLVFIVSGRALNTSQQPLKGIQIESTLYGDDGLSLDSKSIYCGNAMSLKIVKDLSSKEISLLQRLEPPQRFEIQPGESAAFTVVFMSPPEGLKQFSARVVAAERTMS